jgi:integrase
LIDRHVEALKPRKRSWHTDELFLRKYVRPAVGRYRTSDVTLEDLEKIKAQVGQRQAASSTNLLCTTIRNLFESAIRWELLQSSPAQKLIGVRPPPPHDIILSAKEVRRIEGALDQELHRLMAAMIRFLIYTGRRSGEVVRLQ